MGDVVKFRKKNLPEQPAHGISGPALLTILLDRVREAFLSNGAITVKLNNCVKTFCGVAAAGSEKVAKRQWSTPVWVGYAVVDEKPISYFSKSSIRECAKTTSIILINRKENLFEVIPIFQKHM